MKYSKSRVYLGTKVLLAVFFFFSPCLHAEINFQKVESAADEGDRKAQFILARAFQTGEGRPKSQSKAIFWYQKSADGGYAPAQNNLGVCYKIGKGVSVDYSKAAEYFKKAADQGDSVAQLHLGTLYNIGRGVPQDYLNAIFWYKKSSDQKRKRRQSHTFTYFREIALFFPSAITPARIPDPQYRTVVQ